MTFVLQTFLPNNEDEKKFSIFLWGNKINKINGPKQQSTTNNQPYSKHYVYTITIYWRHVPSSEKPIAQKHSLN